MNIDEVVLPALDDNRLAASGASRAPGPATINSSATPPNLGDHVAPLRSRPMSFQVLAGMKQAAVGVPVRARLRREPSPLTSPGGQRVQVSAALVTIHAPDFPGDVCARAASPDETSTMRRELDRLRQVRWNFRWNRRGPEAAWWESPGL